MTVGSSPAARAVADAKTKADTIDAATIAEPSAAG
jgi:hypothetical protein